MIDPFEPGMQLDDPRFRAQLNRMWRATMRAQPKRGGPGILISVDADGWTARTAPQPTIAAAALQPLQGVAADILDAAGNVTTSRVRVVYGQIGFVAGDILGMKPDETGTVHHPYFYVSSLSDGDIITVHQTIAYDGNFWRITASECVRYATGAVPANTTTQLYHQLFAVSLDHYTRATTVQSPQMIIGNKSIEIRGNADSSAFQLAAL